MSDKPIKTCDFCGKTGAMPTFMDGETVCDDCMKKSSDMSRAKYFELMRDRDHFKEIARQYTQMASNGIYHTVDELAQHDAELINNFVAGIISCIKAISPEISQHKNTLCIRELKAFRDAFVQEGAGAIKRTANQLRQKSGGRLHEVLSKYFSLVARDQGTWFELLNTDGYKRRQAVADKMIKHAHLLIRRMMKRQGIKWSRWVVERRSLQHYKIVRTHKN
mgnify:CR=1 FL=1